MFIVTTAVMLISNCVKVLALQSQQKVQRSQLECSPRLTKEPVNRRRIPASSDYSVSQKVIPLKMFQ